MLSTTLVLTIIVVVLAVSFDFINGFHDTANAVATSIATRALSPRVAITIAAFCNFLGAISSTAVAKTIGKDIVAPELITLQIIIAGLLGAIIWNLLTWYFGIPSSSSHALLGGMIGAIVIGKGVSVLKIGGIMHIIAALILSPILGLVVGFIIMTLFFQVFGLTSPYKVNSFFRKGQCFSAALTAFSHGSNDAQKSMGIITMALYSTHSIPTFHIPPWVMVICALAMALGTATGGQRIIKTVGNKIFKLQPINGVAADLTSSLVIFGATSIGAPVSTTHVVSSSIMGVGAAKRFLGVKWTVAQQIVSTWFITIPCTALCGAIIYTLIPH